MTHREQFLRKCLVIDTETTNVDYKEAEVIEMGYVIRQDGKWETTEKLYKPHKEIPPDCSAVNNISNKMVEKCPYFEDDVEMYKELFSQQMGEDYIMIAHNAFYDQNVLNNYGFSFPNSLSTLRIVKKLFPVDSGIANYKLAYLRYYMGILDPADFPELVNTHRAGFDALVAAHLLEKCLDFMETKGIIDTNLPYYEQIEKFLMTPVQVVNMPFGKHKGKPLKDVPLDYWRWAVTNMNCLDEKSTEYDADLSYSINKIFEEML